MMQEKSLKDMVINNHTAELKEFLSDENNHILKTDLNGLFILSASLGYINIAEILLSHGANINATMPFGDTALMWAITKHRTEMALFLINKGININAQNTMGNTALIFAVKEEQLGLIEQLVLSGAKVDKTNKSGETAFMVAEKCNKFQAKELLFILTNHNESVHLTVSPH